MSAFFCTLTNGNVVTSVKQVKSNVIKVVDGVEQLFSDLDDHMEIESLETCDVGNKWTGSEFIQAGVDSQGQNRWFDPETGTHMENVYDSETGVITGSQEVS